MQNLGQMTRGGNAMRNSNSSNMTSADLSSHLGPVSGGHLYVQFSYERVRLSNDGPTNGQFETRLCVEISPKGDRLTTARRYISEEDAAREFPYEYANFSEYESVPTSGTPLFELPGISQSQIALLTLHNLRSIEDVAKCPPELINFMGMDVIQAATTARKWMQSKSENAPMIEAATKEAELDAKLMAISRQRFIPASPSCPGE